VPALVVLPTYNESENITTVLRRLLTAAPEVSVLVVDDSSPDGTADIARSIGGSVQVMERPAKSGLGSAYRDGFRWGLERGFDALVEMDSDLSHEPESVPMLLGAVAAGADLAVGSRYVPGGRIPNWAMTRRALSKAGNLYASAMLGLSIKDATSGFRAYSARILTELDLGSIRADGYGFQIEMAYRVILAKGTVAEIPISFVDRTAGTSKMSSKIVVEALSLVTLWGLRRQLSRFIAIPLP
jgi:dolichol-phosphate mannosyltransferase